MLKKNKKSSSIAIIKMKNLFLPAFFLLYETKKCYRKVNVNKYMNNVKFHNQSQKYFNDKLRYIKYRFDRIINYLISTI